MILECPNCDTHYEIPVELPPGGRKVRCASCQHIWQAMPPEEKPETGADTDFASIETTAASEASDSGPEQVAETDTDADAGFAPIAETAATDEPDSNPEEEASTPEEKPAGDIEPNLAALDEFADEEIVFKSGSPAEDEPTPETAAEAPPPETGTEPPAPEETPAGTGDDMLSDTEMQDAFSAAVAEAGMAEEEEPESPPIVIGKARKKKSASLPTNLAAGWAALAISLAAVLAVGYFQRVQVVQLLPGAATSYERLGLPVNVRGLAFEDVKYSWETSAGRPVLEVAGEILNITSKPLKVPTVVFGLRTKEKVEVYQWAADVRAEMLPPGERTAFAAQIPSPPKSIRDVQVRFAKVQ